MAIVKKLADQEYVSATADEIVVVKLDEYVPPIGGESIGGVKNGGNVVIGEDGSMSVDIPEGFSGSWNDLTDKPFYSNVTETLIVTESLHASYSSKFGCGFEKVNGSLNLETGKTYNVIFNGVTYSDLICYVEDYDSCLALGGHTSCGGGENDFSAYPFIIHDKGSAWRLFIPDTMDCTVEIIKVEKTNLLLEEYIPEAIARISDIPEIPDTVITPVTASIGQTIVVKSVDDSGKPTEWEAVDPWVMTSSVEGSTKKFKLTIDDEGVITATEIVESET